MRAMNHSRRTSRSRFLTFVNGLFFAGLLMGVSAPTIQADDIAAFPVTVAEGTTVNWTGGAIPTSGNFLTYTGNGTFDSQGINIHLGGAGTATVNDNITNAIWSSSGGMSLNVNAQTLTTAVGAGSTLTISGSLTSDRDGSALVKTGAGTLILSNANNTFNHGLTVNEGIVKTTVNSDKDYSAIGGANNPIVVNPGATLWIAGTGRATGYHTGPITVNSGTLTLDGNDTSFGASKTVTLTGTATVNSTNTNVLWRIRNGERIVAGTSDTTDTPTNATISTTNLEIRDGNTPFEVVGADDVLTVSSTFRLDTNGRGIVKSGAGTLNLTGNLANVNGALAVTGGTLNVTTSAEFYNVSGLNLDGGTMYIKPGGNNQVRLNTTAGAITFGSNGGTLTSDANLHFANNTTITTTANGTKSLVNGANGLNLNGKTVEFNVADNSELEISSNLWNSGKLVKTGTGTLNLSKTNGYSYTSGTQVDNGKIITSTLNGAYAINRNTDAGTFGTMDLIRNTSTGLGVTNTFSGGGVLNLISTDDSGYGHMDFANATLSDFTGTINIDGARMAINDQTDLGSTAGVSVNVKPNGQLYITGSVGSAETSATNKITLAGTGWNEQAGRLGAIRLQGGTLFGAISLSDDALIRAYSGAGTLNGTINTNEHTLTMQCDSGNITVNSNISGNGNLLRNGGNYTLFLAGDNSAFTGTITATNSNLYLSSATAGSAAANWVVNSTLASTIGTGTIQLGALSGTGTVRNDTDGSVTYEIGALGTDSTFSGTIKDNSGGSNANQQTSIKKVGSGTLNLTGNLTNISGTLAVTGGTLNVTPSADFYNISGLNLDGGTMYVKPGGNNQVRLNATTGAITFGSNGGTLTSDANLHFANNTTITTTANGAKSLVNGAKSLVNGTKGLNLNTKTVEFNVADNSELEINTSIWNGGILNKTGAGTLTLNLNAPGNENTPGLTVSDGTVVISSDIAASNWANIEVKEGAILDTQGLDITAALQTLGGKEVFTLDFSDGAYSINTAMVANLSVTPTASFELLSNEGLTTPLDWKLIQATNPALISATGTVEGPEFIKMIYDASFLVGIPDVNLVAHRVDNGYVLDVSVPEPSTWLMLVAALGGLAFFRRKK